VQIPKGVTSGQHIRLAGKGAPGAGQGKAGDLYLEVSIREDPAFRIEGRDVFMDLPVTPWEAALGGRVSLNTPSGQVELTVPKHAQSGKKLRLKGRGIPGKQAGDLYALLKIVIPPDESDKRAISTSNWPPRLISIHAQRGASKSCQIRMPWCRSARLSICSASRICAGFADPPQIG